MDSKILIASGSLLLSPLNSSVFYHRLNPSPLLLSPRIEVSSFYTTGIRRGSFVSKKDRVLGLVRRRSNGSITANSTPVESTEERDSWKSALDAVRCKTGKEVKSEVYTVGDFMTRKENLRVVKPSTTVDEALETLVENRISGLPVIDDDWKLVGLVSDYDLLALDTISGSGLADASMFPEVDSTWKVFNELQKLLSKTNGQVVADVMTQAPIVVHETTNLEDATRLLLETRYRRLPVVDTDGKLVGIISRGNVIRAALQIKRAAEKEAQ